MQIVECFKSKQLYFVSICRCLELDQAILVGVAMCVSISSVLCLFAANIYTRLTCVRLFVFFLFPKQFHRILYSCFAVLTSLKTQLGAIPNWIAPTRHGYWSFAYVVLLSKRQIANSHLCVSVVVTLVHSTCATILDQCC